MSAGTGRVVEVVAEAIVGLHNVRSSRVLRGPFLVVSVIIAPGPTGNAGAEVTIVPERIRDELFEDPGDVRGARFMRRMPTINVAGGPAIGDPRQFTEVTYLWPWYVHEGDGALALWVLSAGGAADVAWALCSVWDLVPVSAVEAARVDPVVTQAAKLAEWRALVERSIVQLRR